MRLALILMLAIALVSCGKKADDKKTDSAPESKQELTQRPTATGTPGRDSVSSPEIAQAPAQSTKSAPGRDVKSEPLKNKRWKLVRMNGAPIDVTEDFKSDPYITFSAHTDRLTGSGGCNRFGCKYTQDGSKIGLHGFASTKMKCQEAMDVEKPFLDGLASVNGFVMDGEDKLWLTQDGKRVMEFVALYLN